MATNERPGTPIFVMYESTPSISPTPTLSRPITPVTEHVYKNETIYGKSHDILVSITADVNFIFETETGGVVKISANKACLSTSSTVFDRMFNGALKEAGDIEIVDVSPAAFKEFLQFFYEHEVKLTMDNIFDVVKLIDKYDVSGGHAICIQFLKENITYKDCVWGLHMAIKFNLDELKDFCIAKIRGNYKVVIDEINFDEDGKFYTRNDHRLSDIDWNIVLPHIHMIAQGAIQSVLLQLRSKVAIYSLTLTTKEESWHKLSENETIVFELNKSMMLRDVVCSNVFQHSGLVEHNVVMSIERKPSASSWYAEVLFTKDVHISKGVNNVTLPKPILIQPQYLYAINFRFVDLGSRTLYTYKSIAKGDVDTLLAPNVVFSFHGNKDQSMINTMYFTHLNA